MATLTGPAFTTTNTLDAQRGHLIAKEQKSCDGTLLARYAHAVNTLGQREQVSATRGVSTSPCRCQVAQPCQKMTTDPVSQELSVKRFVEGIVNGWTWTSIKAELNKPPAPGYNVDQPPYKLHSF